ncbi:MAG TPA: DUF503 domain-containing protein [Acidimicrobiales bacterium]|nr:DUF503 domain-containing protein [Acidimicrobiales bacterium]
MYVLSLEVQVRIPAARSLKDRRQVLRPILDGARRRFKVSAAEVEGQRSWQRAGLGFAVVASTYTGAVEAIDAVERFVWSFPEIEVLDTIRTWSE